MYSYQTEARPAFGAITDLSRVQLDEREPHLYIQPSALRRHAQKEISAARCRTAALVQSCHVAIERVYSYGGILYDNESGLHVLSQLRVYVLHQVKGHLWRPIRLLAAKLPTWCC